MATITTPPRSSRVAILRTRPETVVEDYRRLLALAGVGDALSAGAQTILKDNITWHHLYPGVNTTPWQLEGTILGLMDAGLTDLVNVHNRTVVTDPVLGQANLKFTPVVERHGIPVKYNFKDQDMRWVPYVPKAEMLALHRVFPEGIRVPDFFFHKNIVHLPTVKTHSYTTMTGAMKNAFGGLLNSRRHYTHTWIHETLVDLLAIQQEIHSGLFAVMDGTTAGAGPGPRTVIPLDKNVILASADQVAIDALSASLMGFDPLEIPCIRIAHERGLGTGKLKDIEILGDESAARERWGFEVGVNFATFAGRLLWHSPLKVFQKALFHTPLVNAFVLASAIYHDRAWYPVKGHPVVRRWLKESPWGQLFESYS